MFRDCCREGVPAVRQGKGGWEIYRAFSAGARSPAGVDRRGRRRSGEVSELVTWFGEFS